MEKKPLILENGQLKEMSSSDTIPIQNLGSGSVDSTKYLRADGKWVTPPTGAGLADGDKGDITVSGGGTIWTIDNLAVTDAKINDVAATKVTEDTTHRFATDAEKTSWNSKEPGITAGTTGQYWRGDKTWQTLDKTAVGLGNVVNADTTTTANITDSLNKRFITDAQQTVLNNTSGSNTGDETTSSIKTKLGAASGAADGYLTAANWTTFNNKQSALTNPVTGTGTNNEIAAFNSTGSTITSLTTATYPSLTELAYVKGVTSAIQTQINGKEPTITNGFGLTGTTTKSVSLTTSSAYCTTETTISAVTYADITGASITLAAGTWLLLGTINGASQTTTVAVMMAAITDGANTVVVESSQHIPAGTATVRTWGSIFLTAIVSPSGTTTYKLRGAKGTTTQTGNWIASDGNGVNTVNNVSNNSDKGTVIMAIRIA